MIPVMPRTKPVQVTPPSVDGLAANVMAELHTALSELLANAGEPIARAVDVERVFRLDKTLSWQVFRLSQSAELAEAGNVPSRTAVRRLLDAARRRKTPKAVMDRVSAAFEQFEELAAVHGGDRAGLLSMMSGMLGDKSQQYDLKIRKSVFRGQAHLWGVHARMAVRTAIFMPREVKDGQIVGDLALLSGDIGMAHRFQSEPLVMHRWLWTHDESAAGNDQSHQHAAVDEGPIMLPEFSTQPLPTITDDGTMYGVPQTRMVFPPGLANAVTLYSLQQRANFPTPVDQGFYFQSVFKMPIEVNVWELLIPAGWSNPASARAAIFGCRENPERVYDERISDLMHHRVSLDYLGVHTGVPILPGETRHAAAVRHAIEAAGWTGTRFDVYRCRVEYPLLFTMLSVRVELAKRA